ncbi:type IV pilus biogenesis protein PilP [Cupriavidus pinatubonensis]|uniref:type IV pilus biogenesis protein PilP n=1 Tax=Cupriavidus pinatubonensis TaxID=248026 RepID=UPI001FD379E3|nr:type IV pilus biogenesis protein PilP [Cupriavidus pinatubonensis]
MQRSNLLSAVALIAGATFALPSTAAQEDPAEVVAQQRTLAVWSSITQQDQLVDAQLKLAKKQQELEALQGASVRAKMLATAETARRDTLPVVARISAGDTGKLYAVLTYTDGQEGEVSSGDRLRGSSCRVESVSDVPEIGVSVRCGKKQTRLQYASMHTGSPAAPSTQPPALTVPAGVPAGAPRIGLPSAPLTQPVMVPATIGQGPLYGNVAAAATAPQARAQ